MSKEKKINADAAYSAVCSGSFFIMEAMTRNVKESVGGSAATKKISALPFVPSQIVKDHGGDSHSTQKKIRNGHGRKHFKEGASEA